MKEAREKQPEKKKMTYAERREAEKRAGKHRERGRRSARGDDAPHPGLVPRRGGRLAQQPPPPRDEPSARSLDVHSRPRHLEGRGTIVIDDKPSRPAGRALVATIKGESVGRRRRGHGVVYSEGGRLHVRWWALVH